MKINPFNNTNLNDLQHDIKNSIYSHLGKTINRVKEFSQTVKSKGKQRMTVMLIPHSEKKIFNFHISVFSISFVIVTVIAIIVVTSTMIVNHSSTIKEVSKLEKNKKYSRLQVKDYKEEINKLYAIFNKFKPEITDLYGLTAEKDRNSLWAMGGVPNPNPKNSDAKNTPPVEILNAQEIIKDLETTKTIITKIKKFIEVRKKIIENTPSIWPTEGSLVSRYGRRSSPYSYRKEFHNGIDIQAYPGAPIRATAPGVIIRTEWHNNLGLTISIKHKYGFVTSYSHCQRVTVNEGMKVAKGDIIGYVGKTGKTINYICYYQIMVGTQYVNPMPYLNRITRADTKWLKK